MPGNRLFLVGFWGEPDRRKYFEQILDHDVWRDWRIEFLDHTYRPSAAYRGDYFPAYYSLYDDYIRDKRWVFKALARMLFRVPKAAIASFVLDWTVLRRREGLRGIRGLWKSFEQIAMGFGTVSAKILYGRSLGIAFGKQDCVAIFGSNHPTQRLLRAYCKSLGIRMVSIEHGSLSGTLHFVPESVTVGLFPMVRKQDFSQSDVNDSDIQMAKSYLDEVKSGNRDQKPQVLDKNLIEKLNTTGKRVIFIPGLGNIGGGLYPRFSSASRLASPFFRSNNHLVETVLRLTRERDWLVVYKPHPNAVEGALPREKEERLIIAGECSVPDLIRASNVIVCLGTKLAQTALALGRPVVLAGSYSLSGMGCCYEMAAVQDLETKICEALDRGLTSLQEQSYLMYAARELKYCLFQYKGFSVGRFGRSSSELPILLNDYFSRDWPSPDEKYMHSLIFKGGLSSPAGKSDLIPAEGPTQDRLP